MSSFGRATALLVILPLVGSGEVPQKIPIEKHGRVLAVGVGKPFATPSQVAAAVRDGDTVEISGSTYEADVAVWKANNLTLRGVGGRPHLKAGGAHAEGKAIWVIRGNN